jgi:hypothetical protein
MRSTIHLVSADDYSLLWPLMRAVLAGSYRGSHLRKELGDVPVDEVLTLGRELLAEQPRTRAELRPSAGRGSTRPPSRARSAS